MAACARGVRDCWPGRWSHTCNTVFNLWAGRLATGFARMLACKLRVQARAKLGRWSIHPSAAACGARGGHSYRGVQGSPLAMPMKSGCGVRLWRQNPNFPVPSHPMQPPRPQLRHHQLSPHGPPKSISRPFGDAPSKALSGRWMSPPPSRLIRRLLVASLTSILSHCFEPMSSVHTSLPICSD
jgi:hypothetical protein